MLKQHFLWVFIFTIFPLSASDNKIEDTKKSKSIEQIKKDIRGWIKRSTFDWLYAEVYDDAKKHMLPELASCNDFTCIKNLLYKEEQDALEKLFDEYKVSPEKRARFYADVADVTTYNPLYPNDYYPNPVQQLHDKNTLGDELVNTTVAFLKEYGVNPEAVKIYFDKEYFEKNKQTAGAAQSCRKSSPATIFYNAKMINQGKIDHSNDHVHIIAHEVTHVVELHGLKRTAFLQLVWPHVVIDESTMYKDPSSAPDAYRALRLAQETQAELFPLLDFGTVHGKFDEFIHGNVSRCVDIMPQEWNTSLRLATHPPCSKLVPYIAKIKELEKKGAKPLLRRLDE